jgi:hypothetical protein
MLISKPRDAALSMPAQQNNQVTVLLLLPFLFFLHHLTANSQPQVRHRSRFHLSLAALAMPAHQHVKITLPLFPSFLSSAVFVLPLPTVNLKSDTGAESISHWLQQHARQLQELELSTVGLYSRHIHPPTRLRLFQALHAAAGSTAAEHLGDAGRGAANAESSSGEEEEQPDTEQQQQDAAGHQVSSGQLEQQPTGAAAEAAGSPAGIAAATADADTQHAPHDHQQQQQQQQTQIKPLRLTHLAVNARLAIPDCAAIASLPAPHLASLALLGSRTRRLGFDGVGSLAQLRQLTSLKVGFQSGLVKGGVMQVGLLGQVPGMFDHPGSS